MQTVPQYGVFEVSLVSGGEEPVAGEGIFSKDGREYRVKGFSDGDGYCFRFMPGLYPLESDWKAVGIKPQEPPRRCQGNPHASRG
jgi:hypothetical protein